ncbi:MAG: TetR/AcrR family transcriptional regulator [Acidimicrobiia bacterium]|nr:TetR/AcrR family transcriptional regulator [Acidimicrobiia bacterium]
MVDRILEAAARIFVEQGYHETTTNHVAEAAGVSVGSLYQYFPNKDALLVGLAERHVAEAVVGLGAVAGELRAAAPGVEATCRAFVTAAVAVNQPDQLHHILWTAPRTAALQETLHELDRLLMEEVSWHLQRFGHPADLAPLRAALLVTSVSAVIHEHPQGDVRDEELVRFCVAYVNNR